VLGLPGTRGAPTPALSPVAADPVPDAA
jgi:hypothetical protein